MASHSDRLESNLRKKTELLDRIYACNDRLRDRLNGERIDYEDYDEYLEEKGALLEELDLLETESDHIYKEVTDASHILIAEEEQKKRILSLVSEINGKIEAVREIEAGMKSAVDSFFVEKRMDIRNSRKHINLVSSYHRSRNYSVTEENSILDIKIRY